MQLIVTDLDGTLLNDKKEISKESIDALLAAQKKGIAIAIATGRTYGNAFRLCQKAGLNPHIISNHGAFVYTKAQEQILGISIGENHVRNAVTWLKNHHYFYSICTDKYSFIPQNTEALFLNDYKTAQNLISDITEEDVRKAAALFSSMDGKTMLAKMEDVFDRNLTFGSIAAITFDQEKLRKGRTYFSAYPYLTMTIAGRDIFEMIAPSVSKGNALDHLTRHLGIPMEEVMAIGDNYNDLSMLKKAGISVAIGNAEEEVKSACQYISVSNNLNGVAYIVNRLLGQ